LREISRSEAIVTARLLAGAGRRNRQLPDERIPRRTAQVIRQRLAERDSIKERYVPDPAALGRPIVTFALAQPYAEMRSSAIATWRSYEGGVDVWAFKDSIFGVFFLPEPGAAKALREPLGDPRSYRSAFFLDCDSRVPTVPVFFDFEASWGEITGLRGTLAYPHSLPCSGGISGIQPNLISKADREALCSLMARQLHQSRGSTPDGWTSRFAQGARERRLVRSGLAQFRSFLEPAACSRWASNFPEAVALVRGGLVDGKTAPELFRALVEDCRANPFLFVTDNATVLFACLARGSGDRKGPPSFRRTPLLPTIQKFLRQIVVLREPLDSLDPVVDHRYDRPFSNRIEQ
jgi:hypothetical protein